MTEEQRKDWNEAVEDARESVKAGSGEDIILLPAVMVLAADAELKRLEAIVQQVDEVLTVNWIGGYDGDYRKALSLLVQFSIQIENDPQVSETARVILDEITHRMDAAMNMPLNEPQHARFWDGVISGADELRRWVRERYGLDGPGGKEGTKN